MKGCPAPPDPPQAPAGEGGESGPGSAVGQDASQSPILSCVGSMIWGAFLTPPEIRFSICKIGW